MTPLILAGPPLMFILIAAGEVGVVGDPAASSFFAASLPSLAFFADSVTPLIFGGPPFMFVLVAVGDVGVLGDLAFGDEGDCVAGVCFGCGGFTGCAVDVVFSVVAGGGCGFSFDFILSTIAAALEATPFGLSTAFVGEPFTFDAAAVSLLGVPSNAEPLSIAPRPPSIESLAV